MTLRQSNPKEYKAWQNMISRCQTKSSCQYKDYGGRGIKVCDRWLGIDGFNNFLEDLGNKPDKYTLDRVDVDGNYTPENCRWASYNDQNHNQRIRITNSSGFRGVSFSKQKNSWIANIWKNYKMIYLGTFTEPEEAALAYDTAAIQIYGNSANTNILELTNV